MVIVIFFYVGSKALSVYSPTQFKNPEMEVATQELLNLECVEKVKYEYSRSTSSLDVYVYINIALFDEFYLTEMRNIVAEKINEDVMNKIREKLGVYMNYASISVYNTADNNNLVYKLYRDRFLSQEEGFDWDDWMKYN